MSAKDLAVSPGYVDIAANLLEIDFALAESIDINAYAGSSGDGDYSETQAGNFPVLCT
jgi:hypothetical protein